MEMKNSILWIHHNLAQQLFQSLSLGWEFLVIYLPARKSGVQVHHVDSLETESVGQYYGVAN